jgi:hypothetical protein
MESNKRRPEWWIDPIVNIRERLTDMQNRFTPPESNRKRPAKEISKSFDKPKVRSNRKCRK